jgi:glycerol uptake operon antiterminator
MTKLSGVIPSISDAGQFEKFLRSSCKVCFLMNVHIALAASMIKKGHAAGKTIIVHLDMLNGLSSDEAGCEYLCQELNADGVISTKAKAVETAVKNHKTAILRVFLIDSRSLRKGIDLANEVHPDYLEILPAIAYEILPEIKRETDVTLIGGGLLKSREQVQHAFDAGFVAVSSSLPEIWLAGN